MTLLRRSAVLLLLLSAVLAAVVGLAWQPGSTLTIEYTAGQNIGVIYIQTNDPYSVGDSVSVVSGSAPPGVSWANYGSCGALVLCTAYIGTPSSATQTYTHVLRADNGSQTADITVTWLPAFGISGTAGSTAVVGLAYNASFSGLGGTAPFTFNVASGSLPPGVTFDTATGALSGTPTTAGTYNFTIGASDSASGTATSAAQTINVYNALSVTTSSLPATTVGATYSQTLASSGGTTPRTWSIAAGALPAGLSLNTSTGAITGTSSAAGTFNFTAQVACCSGATGQGSLGIVVNPAPVVTTTSLPSGALGVAYSQTLASTDGTGAHTWSVAAGALPAGLSLNTLTGAITGTPAASGTSNFTVQATDSVGVAGTQALSIQILNEPVIDTTSLAPVTAGQNVAVSPSVSGGTAPYNWSVVTGSLPAGISLNSSTGALTGVPAAAGGAEFTLQVEDSNGRADTQALSWQVNAAPSIETSSLPNTTITAGYSQTLDATGGTAPLTWSIASGSLPAGLSFSTSGVLSGNTTVAGTFEFTVQIADGNGVTDTQALSIVVNPAPAINTSALPLGVTTVAYSQVLAAEGGTGAYAWSVAAGSLPAGLSLNGSTGEIAGTPAALGTASFTIQVADSLGVTGTRGFSIEVVNRPEITTSSFAPATVGQVMETSVAATQGTAPYSWSVTAGALPAGLSLNAATGAITGTAGAAGEASFTITVTDANDLTGSRELTWLVNPAPSITTSSLPPTTVGRPYSQALSAEGGTGGRTFNATGFPKGLVFNTAGEVTGSSILTGEFLVRFRVTDANFVHAEKQITLTVNPLPTIAAATLPPGTVGVNYSRTLESSLGTREHAWSVAAGSLPAGLSLSGAGSISGAPQAAGLANFTAQVTDAAGATATQTFGIEIKNPLAITTGSFIPATVSQNVNTAVAVTGGQTPYAWTVAAGSLPPGIVLSEAAGTLSGIATTGGTFAFTISVSDPDGRSVNRAFNWTVATRPQITTSSLPPATATGDYLHALAFAGGREPLVWSAPSLPAGVELNPASGVLKGIFPQAGTVSFSLTVTDANGIAGSTTLSVQVYPEPAILTEALPEFMRGRAASFQMEASGGRPELIWRAWSLPSGVTVDSQGRLTGTPSVDGAFPAVFVITDANGIARERGYSLEVLPPPSFQVTPLELTFSAPARGRTTAPQQVTVTSVPARAALRIASSASWLTVAIDQAMTPAVLTIAASPAKLDPRVYRGFVTIEGPETRTVGVQFTVTEAPARTLVVDPNKVEVSTYPNAPAVDRLLLVEAEGGDGDPVSAASSVPWVVVSAGPAPEDPRYAATVSVKVDPAGLPAGTHATVIEVARGEMNVVVPVKLTVSPFDYDLSHSGLTFDALVRGVAPPPQELRVLNHGALPLHWYATTTAPWIRIQPPSEVADPVSYVGVRAETAGLEAGVYSGEVIVSPHAGGAERRTEIRLNVTWQALHPTVAPAGLSFRANGFLPEPKQIVLTNPSGAAVDFVTSVQPMAATWFLLAPGTGSVPAGGSTTLTANVNPAGLPTGVHRARLILQFADATVRVVDIALTVVSSSCTPSRLTPVLTKLGDAFEVRAGWPAAIEARITDDCGNPLLQGAAVVSFSQAGEPVLTLQPGPDGLWTGTWTPKASYSSITATVTAENAAGHRGSVAATGVVAAGN